MNLKEKLLDMELYFDDIFYDRINNYIALLKQWGQVHNLTARLEDEYIEANIIDSIYPLKFLSEFKTLADVGTGAGFPGMILAIARPENKIVLFEPRKKRASFLNFVKNFLGLINVEVIDKRVEEVHDKGIFDLIVSRAVTNTALLLELTKGLSDKSTSFLFYKGSMLPSELKEARINEYEVINKYDRNYLYINKNIVEKPITLSFEKAENFDF